MQATETWESLDIEVLQLTRRLESRLTAGQISTLGDLSQFCDVTAQVDSENTLGLEPHEISRASGTRRSAAGPRPKCNSGNGGTRTAKRNSWSKRG